MTGSTIDYFLAPQSPWTYLGHRRFVQLAKMHGRSVQVLPMDLGTVFPVSGGLPLAKRAPQRQKYRLVELQRFSEHLALPLHLEPKFFPVAGDDAARLIIAADLAEGSEAALELTGAVLEAVWSRQLDIASQTVLKQLLAETGLPAQCLADAGQPEVQQRYQQNTDAAIAANVFGSPTYIVDGEMFWGQDRLEFVERQLQRSIAQ
jgi:2-hydroxychromene-2-carboxylate isomerase